MKLYYSRGACSLASHIVLHEADLPAELEKVDLKTKTSHDGGDFTKVNPNGYVPVLQLDDGQFLTENDAILQYLADLKPQSGLAPAAGTLARYRLMEWLSFISSELHKGYSPLFAPTTPEEYKATVKNKLTQRLGYVDRALAGSDYLLGNTFTVADAYLFVVLSWSRATHVDLTAFANLQAFQQRVAHRPAVHAAMLAEGLVK
ncbi:MAG TPA: glutathione transferase GstA [Steroidobacteraceae bacterium]|jgi:glutathione S-transferase